jgi:formate/nitrite transporter FocA (FNT family)
MPAVPPATNAKTSAEKLEEETIKEAAALSPKLIYKVIRRDGEEELARTRRSMLWSGIAAGRLISLSVLGEANFRTYLPDTQWRHLVENIGYLFGFLAVIMGRVQLLLKTPLRLFCL